MTIRRPRSYDVPVCRARPGASVDRCILRGVLLALGLAALPVAGGAQQKVQRRIAIDADASIKVWVPSGSIRIVGWDRDSLVVEGTIAVGSTLFFGGAGAAAKFGVEEATGAKPPAGTVLVAYVPRGGQVSVRTVTASIEAIGISGSFNTVGGDVRISGAAREINAEAMDGDVTLDVSAPYVRARTASGALTASGRCEDIALATVSGSLTIDTRGIARGRFESVTGPIVLRARLERTAGIEIDNHSGSVELQLASPLTGEVDLTSVTGTITNGLVRRLPVAGSKGKGQELKVDTGRDGPAITVRTFKGPIVLERLE